MKKRMGLIVAAALLLAGCKNKEQVGKEDYEIIVDDYAKILLLQDSDSADYDRALEAVGSYLKEPDEETLKTARSFVQETVSQMEETSSEITSYEITEDFSDLLKEHGIEPEEYMMNADARPEELADYISTLQTLEEYLGYEETDDLTRSDLSEQYEMAVRVQEIMKNYNYCGINYWFAGWEEEAVSYVKQQVQDKLASFYAGQEAWQDDRDAVEQRMMIYLNELEELLEEWADRIGERQDEQYQLQND